MKENKVVDVVNHLKLVGAKQRVAFHEAGHAAGIHLNNKARELPAIYFKIIFKSINADADADVMVYNLTDDNWVYHSINDDCIARVEGGRLLSSIDSMGRDVNEFTSEQVLFDYRNAIEADIINLLIGPLAEARHIADSDNELFNHKLVNLDALKNYGGSADIALADEYLQKLFTDKQQRNEKLDELFTSAFYFVTDNKNWVAITKLAEYILDSSDNIIYCEEIISLLDQSIGNYQDMERRLNRRH